MPKIHAASAGEGVQAVVLALKILDHVARQSDPVGVTSLAQALGTTKSRIYRYLRTLVQQGYIVQAEDSEKYRVGGRLVTLGRAVSENLDLAMAARPVLRELRDALGHFAVVSQVESEGVRVLATVSGKSAIEIGVKPGSVLGFHYSAQGKVALAFGSEDLRARVFRERLEMRTPRTIVNQRQLRDEIERVRRQGWAVAPSEALIGTNALAAPVFEAGGDLVGTVAIVDSVQFIPEGPSEEQVRRIVDAGRRISESLGHSSSASGVPATPHSRPGRIAAATPPGK